MARIKLKFYDKEYIIEYKNRDEVKNYFVDLDKLLKQIDKLEETSNEYVDTSLKAIGLLIKAGLVEHHKDDMPSDSDIEKWVMAIPNPTEFFNKLMSLVQGVVSSVEQDAKNLTWEVEED